ncbi:pneumococcal serine-rich repeat protein isoform X12 [Drosophila bipectinata]|uniref:pneumococcal serine-rich repeat protein isoform X12 n=1 Tax=Drosophila bipectinata TaxID=42026 RepID=UPI001C8A6338|nr:mucin-19 isoform X4 [Drosophila bipectinata]
MLAIKECLIREGVLNLDAPDKCRQYQLHGTRSSGSILDMSRYRKTIAASSDLSTAPATAKSSCQPSQLKKQKQELPQPEQQQSHSEDSGSQKPSYRGQHPHFHHHTTPAYYTDLQLRIHTPNASDVGALNENYRSVYSTPSTQLVEERSFPKSSKATVAPPPINSSPPAPTQARGAFFRGDSACSDSHTRRRGLYPRTGSEGRCFRFSQASVSPTKGEVVSTTITGSNTPLASTTTTTTSINSSCDPVEPASPPPVVSNPPSGSGRNSRHKQRFHSRSRRAVRVRSESRPISALYDIICKERNLDVGASNSSSSSSNEQDPADLNHQSPPKQPPNSTTDKLATFWPLHHHYLNPPPMSSSNLASSGSPTSNTKQPSQKPIQKPSHDGNARSGSSSCEEGSAHALHSSRKVTNLSAKAKSLPPSELASGVVCIAASSSEQVGDRNPNPAPRLAKSLEPSSVRTAPPASQDVLNFDAGAPVNTERLFVEPPNVPMAALRRTLYDDHYEIEENDSTTDLCALGAQLTNGGAANGLQHSDPEHEHDHHPPHESLEPVEPVEPLPQSHHHQATNARRFITRTTRSASRQGSAGHSPPPPLSRSAGYRSDSSYSSASPSHSPTRRRNRLVATASGDPPSSANGNSSAYETAATTVMTHGPATPPPPAHHQRPAPPAEVPRAPLAAELQPEAVVPADISATTSSSISSSLRRKADIVSAAKCSISCTFNLNNNCNSNSHSQRHCNNNTNQQTKPSHATPMPPLANANKAPLIVLKAATPTTAASPSTGGAAATSTASSPAKRRTNPLSPLRLGGQSAIAPPQASASPLLSGGSCSSSNSATSNSIATSTSPQSSPAVRTTKASRLRAAALDKKKEEEQRQRVSSPASPRTVGNGGAPSSLAQRRLSNSELSPKSAGASGFNSEPVSAGTSSRIPARSTSQPVDTPPIQRRQPLVAVGSGLSMKQSLSELHFTGGAMSPPKVTAEYSLRMRPRSSTLSTENTENGTRDQDRDQLANLQLSPVQKNKRTPEVSPRRMGDRDKSAKRKSNLNRSLTDEATKDGGEAASANRRRRRRELGLSRPLVPGDDEALRELLHSPIKSSCSESTTSASASKSEPHRPVVQVVRHPEVPVRTMTAVLPAPRPIHAPLGRAVSQKFNERTRTDLAEIKKIAEQSDTLPQPQQPLEESAVQKMSAILRRKSTDDTGAPQQSSPPAPNQIVSILKKKEHGLGECNSSASSNPSPVTFSSSVVDPPLAGAAARSKRQGILKKRSSLDESRYYSRSHSPDERSILIKSARRNSLEESSGAGLSTAQAHGILKQSSYDSSKSDGCPSATESQPHSILKKKDSLSTPSDGGCHKHVSISQAVILAAAELAAHDGMAVEDTGEEHEIRPILKQESTSSEEAVRPPKPILKKKSFGEADEHEIRPILKSSRKSSREEFDLNMEHEVGDSLSSILKTDSPSKRRSLGSASHDLDESNSTPGVLKRRTRSLERQDVAPVMDLAAALDAISTSQATPSTPVDFVATPSGISVAERIKRMEMLSTPTSRSAGGANSSWESPLQSTPEQGSSGTPRLLKPSVLRRDMQRDRYKTQPVTNEEKSFFKANSAPFDISATSAFKPTKPLDIRLNQATHPALISPITGQPLSHVPAPLLLSSSTNSGSGTSFRLVRSATQPLQSPRVSHLAGQGAGPGSYSSLVNDSSANLSEQLTLSVGNDTEHIFDMSGLEEDSAIQSLGDENASASATTGSTATGTPTTSSGLTRSNSVRARANMFQQLQEQTRTQRATGSSRHSPPAVSAAPNPADSSPPTEEPSTPNTSADAEFEPSSLSLAERLAFFSNLCENSGTGSASGRLRSRTSSYSRSPPLDRATPRSSTTASSASGTPTPTAMDYSSLVPDREPTSLTLESIVEPEENCTNPLAEVELRLREKEHVRRSESEAPVHNGFHILSRSATEPTPGRGPTAVNMRTVGKLVVPDTFSHVRTNNAASKSWSKCLAKLQSIEPMTVDVTVRTIGKIKSPFFEKQQQQQQEKISHTNFKFSNGTSDSGSESGKENCASNQQHQVNADEDRAPQKVSEMRRKINRLVQQQQPQAQPVNRRHTTEISTPMSMTPKPPNVDDRYAKYFGVKETFNTTTVLKTQSLPPKTSERQPIQVEATNVHVRFPSTPKRRELLKRTRPVSMDHYASGSVSPTAMPSAKRAHSPVVGRRKIAIDSFEDIEVTQDELHAAGKDFKRLCGEILG